MSSRSSRRSRRPQSGRQKLPPPLTAIRQPGSGWKLGLGSAIGVVLVLVAVWYGTRDKHRVASPALVTVAPRNTSVVGVQELPRSSKRRQAEEAFKARINRGSALMAEGKAQEALQVLSEARQLNPADEDVHYNLGLALSRLGKTDDAIKEYEEALRLYPEYIEAHNNLGNLLMRIGKTDEAIQQFETAVKIMPDYAAGHNNLGTALQRAGRTNEATVHFETAVKINPDYWQARFNVAISRLQEGRLNDARTELQSVLRSKPEFKPAQQALADLDSRQNRPGQ